MSISKRSLLVIAAMGLAASLTLSYYFYTKSQNPSSIFAKPTASNISSLGRSQITSNLGFPLQLRIPKIKVDAKIEQMGITAGGLLDAPGGPKNVGWYKFGPRPGENGSAVIDGHYGKWKNGESSVFDNLNILQKGDIISVDDDRGANSIFIVRELKTYDPKANSASVFKSTDGMAHLNLITCEGSWDDTAKTYSSRLVVFADKQ